MFSQIVSKLLMLLVVSTVSPVYAQEEATLFWGTTCPHCHTVKEEITDSGLDEKIPIIQLEIYENSDNLEIFKERIEECGIDLNNAGVPMLYVDGQCFMGVDPILSKLNQMAGLEEGEVEGIEINDAVDSIDNGKRNTEILLIIGLAGMVALVGIGYIIQKKSKAKIVPVLLIAGLLVSFAKPVFAMCPVCTVAVGAGLGLSRYLGIDDVITGVWIGGLMVSTIMWTIGWLEGKGKKTFLIKSLVIISMYGFLALSLYLLDAVGNQLNQLWGMDKIVLGIIAGSIIFFLSAELHLYLKEKNKGDVYIPFQKVVIPVTSLLFLTAFFYMIVY